MEEVKNNPAGRLYDILRQAQGKTEKEPARKVWAEVFGVDSKSTGDLLKMLADLIDLAHDAKNAIERLEGIDHSLYKKPFDRVERCLSKVNLDAPWKACKDELDETTLLGLQFCSDQLGRATGYASVPSPDFQEILADLSDLTVRVGDSTLPSNLRLLLVRNLEDVRASILAYKIKGLEGVEYEVERGLGSLLLRKEEIQLSQASEESRDVWCSYLVLLERLHKVVVVARDTKELVAPFLKVLGFDGGQ